MTESNIQNMSKDCRQKKLYFYISSNPITLNSECHMYQNLFFNQIQKMYANAFQKKENSSPFGLVFISQQIKIYHTQNC